MKTVNRKKLKSWQNEECKKGLPREESRKLSRLLKKAYLFGGDVYELVDGSYGYFPGRGPIVQYSPGIVKLAEKLRNSLSTRSSGNSETTVNILGKNLNETHVQS